MPPLPNKTEEPMNKRGIWIAGVLTVLLLVGLAIYAQLGGFRAPAYAVRQEPIRHLAGRLYEGHVRDRQLATYFQEADSLVSRQGLQGTSAALYYNDPDTDDGRVRVVVGVLVADTAQSLPAHYAYHLVPAGRYIRAELGNHLLVAPQVYRRVGDFAAQRALVPSDTALEIYFRRDSMTIDIRTR